jgi:hypothetical protein
MSETIVNIEVEFRPPIATEEYENEIRKRLGLDGGEMVVEHVSQEIDAEEIGNGMEAKGFFVKDRYTKVECKYYPGI